MKNLASVIATAALATGCVTTQPETATNTGPNVPRALATSANANASTGNNGGSASSGPIGNTQQITVVPPAVIKWNDESCNKVLTENTLKTGDICVRFAVAGTPITAASAAKPTALTRQNRRTPAVEAAPTTTAGGPAATIYTARVAFSECGVTSSNVAESALETAGGYAGKIVSGLGGLLGRTASQSVGGGVAGRAATEATRSATGSATQQGRTVAANNNPQSAASAACNTQITNFIQGDFKSATTGITADFEKTNPGYKATYTLTSELPKIHDNAIKAVVGEQFAPARR